MSVMFKLLAFASAIGIAAQLLTAQTLSIPNKVSAETQQHIENVISCLHPEVQVTGEPRPCTTLSARMAQLHIPGISMAVIHDGAIEWADGFGVKQLGGSPITADTLFQAGSISKPVAAMAAVHLVQEKKLSLDADVNTELVSWKIPDNAVANGNRVTLRELLTHTAGLTVHGFRGYTSTEAIPTLLQVLNGEKPANSAPIRLESEPGSKWKYSGGGYTVLQQLLIDVAGEPFPKFMQDTVLRPLGMMHSTYQQPLPDALRSEAATPYDWKSDPIPGGAHTYPEMAAAGLWTTPSDLARYCIEIQRSLTGRSNRVLSPKLTQEMVTPGLGHWGLGLEIEGSTTDPLISHGGVNAGFESLLAAYEHHGDGAVIMGDAMGSTALVYELLESIATEYRWPDFRPVIHTPIKLSREELSRFVGVYELQAQFNITVTLEGDQLMVQGLEFAPGTKEQPKFPLFPESKSRFFLKVMKTELEFLMDNRGQVSSAILHSGGEDLKGVKK